MDPVPWGILSAAEHMPCEGCAAFSEELVLLVRIARDLQGHRLLVDSLLPLRRHANRRSGGIDVRGGEAMHAERERVACLGSGGATASEETGAHADAPSVEVIVELPD